MGPCEGGAAGGVGPGSQKGSARSEAPVALAGEGVRSLGVLTNGSQKGLHEESKFDCKHCGYVKYRSKIVADVTSWINVDKPEILLA